MLRLAHHLEQPGVESAQTREDPPAHTLPSELSDWTGWVALPGALCPRRDPSERPCGQCRAPEPKAPGQSRGENWGGGLAWCLSDHIERSYRAGYRAVSASVNSG